MNLTVYEKIGYCAKKKGEFLIHLYREPSEEYVGEIFSVLDMIRSIIVPRVHTYKYIIILIFE